MIDEKYTENLESRIEELEGVIRELQDKILGYHVRFEVYFLIYDDECGIEDCVLYNKIFKTYEDAFTWSQKYLKRKKKRKYFNGFEIIENKLEVKQNSARFWTFSKYGELKRQGDESSHHLMAYTGF